MDVGEYAMLVKNIPCRTKHVKRTENEKFSVLYLSVEYSIHTALPQTPLVGLFLFIVFYFVAFEP